jgi:hypothetical protein
MPVKKITRSKVSAASKKSSADAPATSKSATPSKRRFGGGAMLVTAMCVTGAVIVIAAHELTPSARVTSTDTRSDAEVVSTQPKPTVSPVADPSLAAPKSEAEATKTTAANTAPVTIFGCLERSNDTYRLTDTDGADAPKARSWKSAFFKKGAAAVEVVDPGNHAHLSSHVGHRVGVTGTLADRHLQVRSIRRISSSCSN